MVLSHDAWTRRYGGDPAIVGQTVEIDGQPTPVLGVLPEGFALPVEAAATPTADVYRPNLYLAAVACVACVLYDHS